MIFGLFAIFVGGALFGAVIGYNIRNYELRRKQ